MLSVTDTYYGYTALHTAVINGRVEVARLLIEAGGQRLLLFHADNHGCSPLHFAAWYGKVDVSRLLVERGGKRLFAAKDIQGQTAEDVATRRGHGALAGLLRRARVAKAGSDVWCVSAEEEVLAVVRAEAAMVELLVEEAKPGGAAGSPGGGGGGGAARGRKGKGGSGKKT